MPHPPADQDTADGFAHYYAPLVRLLAALNRADMLEAATALNRRTPVTWPDATGSAADELTLWLSGDKSFGRA